MPKAKEFTSDWMKATDLANNVLGIRVTHLRRFVDGLAPTAKRIVGRECWYNVPAVVRHAIGRKSGKPDERLKLANARLKELDLAERQGELVSVAEVREGLTAVAGCIRRAAERAAAKYGAGVRAAIEEGLLLAERELESKLREAAEAARATQHEESGN